MSTKRITKMGRGVPSFLLLLLLLLMVMLQSVSSVPLVHAPWGALQGVSVMGNGGRKMDAYLGIPYAVPPVGERRFEKPLPHPGPGEGEVFAADKIMTPCPQQPMMIGTVRKTSEDCLMLDVYVPAEENADSGIKPYAVMAFIHGGGYMSGDAYMYRPTKLVADGKVIVVVFQYRLGVLGFLTSGDDALTENLGLWDQNLALRWVKDNIKSFGGDPGRITIFGESAGSWSVGFHLIIPQSRGLFNRAIMQSGAPQNLHQIMDYFDKKTVFKGLTDLVGCEGDNSQQRLQCLKQLPVDYLMNKSIEYEATSPLESYYYPVVDGELILRPPRELLQDPAFVKENGVDDIDVIVGFTKDEGGMVVYMESLGMVSAEALYTVDLFREFVNVCFALMGLPPNNTVLRKATEFYYLRADFGKDVSQTLDPVSDLYGDCLITVNTIEWARLLATAPHSGARYMYVVDQNFVCNEQTLFPGAHHGDDLLLLFDTEMFPEGSLFVTMNKTFLSAEEHSLSDKMVDTWTTFARTGNPSGPLTQELGGPWPQFTVQEELYLSVSTSPRLLSRMGPYADRVALWLQLLPQLQAETSKPAPQEAAEGQGSAREEL